MDLDKIKQHVKSKIVHSRVDFYPFDHIYIEDFFPCDFYSLINKHKQLKLSKGDFQDRKQDNPNFINRKYSLFTSEDYEAILLKDLLSDKVIIKHLVEKFYLNNPDELALRLKLHHEFEYTFTPKNSFQRIHVDIPPKYLSLVFYMPDNPLPEEHELRNGTILYDRSLSPVYKAKFLANSVVVFAPNFSSYHGFDTTFDRSAIVMFYVEIDSLKAWRNRQESCKPPFTMIKNHIAWKLERDPQKFLTRTNRSISQEYRDCLINSPLGRVIRESDLKK